MNANARRDLTTMALPLVLSVVLAGCAATPAYQPPAPREGSGYTAGPPTPPGL